MGEEREEKMKRGRKPGEKGTWGKGNERRKGQTERRSEGGRKLY